MYRAFGAWACCAKAHRDAVVVQEARVASLRNSERWSLRLPTFGETFGSFAESGSRPKA